MAAKPSRPIGSDGVIATVGAIGGTGIAIAGACVTDAGVVGAKIAAIIIVITAGTDSFSSGIDVMFAGWSPRFRPVSFL